MGNCTYRVNTTEKVVYLTFDDGPYTSYDLPRVSATTYDLLTVLQTMRSEDQGVNDPDLSATFFVNGWGFVRRTPTSSIDEPDAEEPCARRTAAEGILELGHDIANHSHNHRNPWGALHYDGRGTPTMAQMVQDVNLCRRAMRRLDCVSHPGMIVPFFRSPGDSSHFPRHDKEKRIPGKLRSQPVSKEHPLTPEEMAMRFDKLLEVAQLEGLDYVSYSIMAHDEVQSMSSQHVYWNVRNRRHLDRRSQDVLSFDLLPEEERRGAIILMHNGRAHTVAALPDVIRYLYEQGYKVRKLPDPLP